MNAKDRERIEVFEIKGLGSICEVSKRDKVKNERKREMCAWESGLVNFGGMNKGFFNDMSPFLGWKRVG